MSAIERDIEAIAQRVRASTVAVRVGRSGGGAGVIWSADGLILTNAHVATRPRAEIVLLDGRRFAGRVQARDARRDLALVQIDAQGLSAAARRDPATLRVGEIVVAVGHPLGIANAVSMGIVGSRVEASAPRGGALRFVRADVRLAPGNSGGPLADSEGRVVGINSMVVAGGFALAVPVDEAAAFAAPFGLAA